MPFIEPHLKSTLTTTPEKIRANAMSFVHDGISPRYMYRARADPKAPAPAARRWIVHPVRPLDMPYLQADVMAKLVNRIGIENMKNQQYKSCKYPVLFFCMYLKIPTDIRGMQKNVAIIAIYGSSFMQ
jgi:hypothetical protein